MAKCNPTLKTFCKCGSLYTGTIVAGISAIILAIIGIIVILTVRVDIKTIVLDWLPKWVVQIIIILNFAMTIILSIVMIIGAMKRKWYLMMPWVVLGFMLIIGLLVSILWTSINFFIEGDSLNGGLWLGLGLLGLVIYIYMWWVSFSYFYEIREEAVRGQYTKDPFRRKY